MLNYEGPWDEMRVEKTERIVQGWWTPSFHLVIVVLWSWVFFTRYISDISHLVVVVILGKVGYFYVCFYLFHLVVVVVLCEVGQAGVDVGPKQGEVDLDWRDLQFHILSSFSFLSKYICSSIPPAPRRAQSLPPSHRSRGCRRPWPCSWAGCRTPPSDRTSTLCTRQCPAIRKCQKKRQIWNLIEVSSIEENRLGILFPDLLLPLVNPGNSTKTLGAVLNFIFLATFLKTGSLLYFSLSIAKNLLMWTPQLCSGWLSRLSLGSGHGSRWCGSPAFLM